MAGLADVTAGAKTLEDQIRARWGKYGDWKSADHDQVAALAKLLRANGIEDISALKFQAQNTTRPGYTQETEAGPQEMAATDFTTYDAFLGDKKIGFLGDINRDGSLSVGSRNPGAPVAEQNMGSLGGDLLAWSSQGGGNTSFRVVPGPDGELVVVPTWGSSRQGMYEDLRGLATVAAVGAGGYLAAGGAGATGAAATSGTAAGTAGTAGINWGAVGSAAAKSAAMNAGVTLARGGDLSDALKSAAIGGVTGAVGGGLSSYGVNPVVSGAVTGATGAALRGADGKDILIGGATGALSGAGSSGAITGYPTIDRAIAAGGNTLIRGGDVKDALVNGGLSVASGATRSGGNSLTASNDEALSDENIVRFDGGDQGAAMDDEFDWDAWTQDQIDSSNRDTVGGLSDVIDFSDPRSGVRGADGYGEDGGLSDARSGVRGADGYGEDGMTGEETAAFDKALQDGTLPDWAKTAAAGFKTAGEFFASPIGKALLATGAFKALTNSNSLTNPVDTKRYDQLFDNMLNEQALASQRGKDLWADYTNIWKPAQQKFADTAMNYDTAGRREQAAQQASGLVAAEYDQKRSAATRDMQMAGVDPSTISALGAASQAWEAKDRAGAQNAARDNVEKTGLKLLDSVVGQGNTVQQQATRQSQVATGTTQAASGILNSQASQQNTNTANRNAIIGDLFKAVGTGYGMYTSSKKTKHVGGKVDGLAAARAVERSPARKWAYKKGQGDGNTRQRMGPMAEDLKREAPQVSNGKQVDGIAQLGLHHAAIGGLSKRMERIEKKLGGLADARKG